jgi:hypothetical protein
MRDAPYLRAQADLCLQIASQMSDGATADKLRAEAARHHAEAAEIEANGQPEPPPKRAGNSDQDPFTR